MFLLFFRQVGAGFVYFFSKLLFETPRTATHFLHGASGFPSHEAMRLISIGIAFGNITRATRNDLVGNRSPTNLLEGLQYLHDTEAAANPKIDLMPSCMRPQKVQRS